MTEQTKPASSRLEALIRAKLAEGMTLDEACDWLATYNKKEVAEMILESIRGRLH